MVRFLLSAILLLPATIGIAQNDTVRKYLDADLHFTTRKDFVYAGMAIKQQDHWVLYAVYPDTSILLKVFFKDGSLAVKDGPFTLYHPKKVAAQQGYYRNNIPEGHWQSWYPTGQLKNQGDMVNNNFSGLWKSWYANGQLMSERNYLYQPTGSGEATHQSSPSYRVEKVLDDFEPEGKLEGPSKTWYPNGNLEAEVNYHNDSLTGACSWYRENGQPSTKETYTEGKVTALACFDSTGKKTGESCSILKLPVLIHPMFTAQDYIVDELHRDKNKDIREEGEAGISFTVTKNGEVENLVIVSSPDPALSRHIIQIIAKMPKWSPAFTHNRTVDHTVTLSIPYYRN